ncbi:sodium/glutamate symporter [Chachezhania sediminis]|uniref:sodium/glutamate symporter n=1 Tax=Chachezhania sediminis TaxID=2599291 RepID=UPI00131DBE4A|nr:sodium/glutamate symporter [Chachezhania sediminis]
MTLPALTVPDLSQIDTIFLAASLIALLLVGGLTLRHRWRVLGRLLLPGSVVAGVVALVLGPDVLGAAVSAWDPQSALADGVWGAGVREVWRSLPSLLINIVFACLFLGKSIPGPRKIWHQAGPLICYGQTVAWGQYVVGLTLALLVLGPLFGMSPLAGALIEIGFEGGHGTAAGLAPVFTELGFEEGLDLALGLASVGLVAAILSGVILIHWARLRGILLSARVRQPVAATPAPGGGDMAETLDMMDVTRAGGLTAAEPEEEDERPDAVIDPLSFHLGLVAASIVIGRILLELMVAFEQATWGAGGLKLLSYVPLFPLAMIGGAVVQFAMTRMGKDHLIDRELVNRIAGVALDFTIVSALATLSLSVIADNFGPFALMVGAGIAWNVGAFLMLAPRMLPGPWFERGIADLGQCMGMTVTGLLLFQMADAKNRSGGLERFGYKQLVFEPIMGGGIFTAISMPLIVQFGPVAILCLTAVVAAIWLVMGRRLFVRSDGD